MGVLSWSHLTSYRTKQIHLFSWRLWLRASGPRRGRSLSHLGHTHTHTASRGELGDGGEAHPGTSGLWWRPASAPCPCPSRSGPRSSAGGAAGRWCGAAGSCWDVGRSCSCRPDEPQSEPRSSARAQLAPSQSEASPSRPTTLGGVVPGAPGGGGLLKQDVEVGTACVHFSLL